MQRAMRVPALKLLLGVLLVLGLSGIISVPQAQAASSYTIVYHLNGGTNSLAQYRTIPAGSTMKVSKLKKPTRTGYTFQGWYKDKAFKTKATKIVGKPAAAGRTLYAKWKAVNYKIVYELNGGVQATDQKSTYTVAAAYTLKAPAREGYAFQGWCTSADLDASSIVTKIKKGTTGKVTLYAKWKKAWDGDVNVAGVEVKDTVDEYSWDELSTLSAAMSECLSAEDATKIAVNYHLCAADGTLTGQERKTITVNPGGPNAIETAVQIVGFCHDVVNEDTVAGITFMFCDAVDLTIEAKSSWESCGLRRFMNGGSIVALPSDLDAVIKSVQKLTNNKEGSVTDAAGVSATTDKLWLFSVVELTGEVPAKNWAGDPWGELIHPGKQCAVYNAEGSQYQYFKDMGVSANAGSPDLACTYQGEKVSWYLRSLDPQYGYRAFVNADESIGFPVDMVIGGFNPYGYKGVVPGFCI